jgi:hypothetical protein
MRCIRALVLVPFLAALSGCLFDRGAVNEPLEASLVAQLTPGRTTASEAVALLGAPTEVVQLGRRSAYRYQFEASKRAALYLVVINLMGSDSRADRVWLFFGEDDVLTHVGSTFESLDTRYALPWTKLHS